MADPNEEMTRYAQSSRGLESSPPPRMVMAKAGLSEGTPAPYSPVPQAPAINESTVVGHIGATIVEDAGAIFSGVFGGSQSPPAKSPQMAAAPTFNPGMSV
jgi:hypothetical protein